MLRKAGAEVEIAGNGAIAVEMVLECEPESGERGPYDVILMDIQMPVMDGREATRLLRARGYTGPIIALTASATESDRRLSIEAGCNDVATKPIERRRFLATIREQLEDKGASLESIERPLSVSVTAEASERKQAEGESASEGRSPKLSDLQRDMLGEILNIGLGLAASGLSEMTGQEILLSAPYVEFVRRTTVVELLESKLSKKLSCVRQAFTGTFEGDALLVFAEERILELVTSIMQDTLPDDLTKVARRLGNSPSMPESISAMRSLQCGGVIRRSAMEFIAHPPRGP